MINSYLLHVYAWAVLALGRIFSTRKFGAAAALSVALALGGLVTGSAATVAQEAAPKPSATVNINSDTAQTMADGLKGVGQARAIEIVRHREAYGPFASVDELMEVKGIGKSTLDMNRTLITLE